MSERDTLNAMMLNSKKFERMTSLRAEQLQKKKSLEENNPNIIVSEVPTRNVFKKVSTKRLGSEVNISDSSPKHKFDLPPTNSGTRTNASMLAGRKRPNWKRKMEKFLNSSPVLIFMSLLTICALFLSDIQAAWLRIGVDYGFNIFQTMLLGFFIIEFIMNWISIKDYSFSFFFWLDFIATVSLIQDIDYIMFPILGYGPEVNSSRSSIQAARAIGKISAATRATRVLRVVRIVRLIRMVKLYKSIYQARENREKILEEKKRKELEKKEREYFEEHSNSINSKTLNTSGNGQIDNTTTTPFPIQKGLLNANNHENKNDHCTNMDTNGNLVNGNTQSNSNFNANTQSNTQSNNHTNNLMIEKSDKHKKNLRAIMKKPSMNFAKHEEEEEDDTELIKESKISRIITESNTKKIIVLILALLVIFPLLSEDFYADDNTIVYFLIAEMISNYRSILGSPNPLRDISFFYSSLFDEVFPVLNITINGTIYFTNKNYTTDYFRYKETKYAYSSNGFVAICYSILAETTMTGWLNILLTIFVCFCLTFATVSLEKQANLLVLGPLEVMMEIVGMVAKDPMNAKNVDNLQEGIKAAVNSGTKTNDNYEAQVIKTAIIKISALLAIGFGEAGGEIIKKNLSSANELNTRLKGKKKDAIFGFCDIRQFEDITLALEERTMIFVNKIAEIVHSSVDRFGGATNKNIGEAFLNVWKFYNETPVKNSKSKTVQKKDNLLQIDPTNPQVSIIADMSVGAFLRILLKINKSLSMLTYRSNESILKKIPDFRLNMGFGLHMGYGIEGAVGSTYKFDASYLSPNVNIAARLESATRQFGTPLLLSGVLYNLFSPEMKKLCRFVDCVQVKGSTQPLELYTIDLNLNVTPENEEKKLIIANKEKRNFYSEKKESFKREVEITKSVVRVLLDKASYLELLKTNKNEAFYANWNKGIKEYKEGNFKEANDYFKNCLELDSTDGPAKTLMNYLKNCNYSAPKNWDGTRELLAK